MDFSSNLALLVLLISSAVYSVVHILSSPPDLPNIQLEYWGPGESKPDRTTIDEFKINIPESELDILRQKLNITSTFVEPLEKVGFDYGVNSNYMKKFLKYWQNNYNWREREKFLNSFPQFKTQIGGLEIHFLHVKPFPSRSSGKNVLPLLMMNGWPSSVREFYEIIPLLSTPRTKDFVFEVIVPSLPGYGHSQGASKPGLGPAQIGIILNELMSRLGFNKYFIHGSDLGAIIGRGMSVIFPNRVLGFHSTLCLPTTLNSLYRTLFVYLFPSFYMEEKHIEPFKNQFIDQTFLEGGYLHIQATKPDTIGLALTDSPVGLAGYILEKFSTWINKANRNLPDGGLENINTNALLDNIMIYWFNKAITTSMRLHSEFMSKQYQEMRIDRNPVNVPTSCASFPNDLFYIPEVILQGSFTNLVSTNHLAEGGHFPALEQPKLLADDLWDFVTKVEKLPKRRKIV